MTSQKILTREQVRELDRRAIEEYGVPSILLMENAARACADEAERSLRIDGVSRAMAKLHQPGSRDDIPRNVDELERWKEKLGRSEKPVVVLCGPGNNGGDGFAIARTLHNRGHGVEVYFVGKPGALDDISGDVASNLELLKGHNIAVKLLSDHAEVKAVETTFAETPLIVDALFGTGLTRTIEDPYRDVIQRANDSGTAILAVDVPSGLDANNGNVLGVSIRAEATVTFVAEKPGFHEGAGPSFCGKVVVAEIGIPRQLVEEAMNTN